MWPFKWKLRTEQYFRLVFNIILYKVVLTAFELSYWWNPEVWLFKWKLLSSILSFGIYIMLCIKEVVTFEFVDVILKWDHSNEKYWAVLSFGTLYHAVQGSCNFWVCWCPKVRPFKWKLLSSTFLLCCHGTWWFDFRVWWIPNSTNVLVFSNDCLSWLVTKNEAKKPRWCLPG